VSDPFDPSPQSEPSEPEPGSAGSPSAAGPAPQRPEAWGAEPAGDGRPSEDDGGHLEVDLAAFLPEGTVLEGHEVDLPSAPSGDDRGVEPPIEHTSGDDEAEASAEETSADAAPVEDTPVESSAPGGVAADAASPDEGSVDEVRADDEPAPAARAEPEPALAVESPTDEPVDLVALQAIEDDLSAVEAALTALDDGTYGSCAVCRAPLDADTLAADPVRRTCAAHTVAAR
jgi:RNA polymerase-binding transcription factor DksA